MPRSLLALTPLETRDTPAVGFTAAGAAPGGQPLAALFRPDGTLLAQVQPFEANFRGGVRAATGELDGDPATQELVAVPGPGGGPLVRVYSVNIQNPALVTPRSAFFAFEDTFRGGLRVAVGNVAARANGVGQIVLAPDDGGGPRVRVVELSGAGVANSPLADFFAFEPGYRGGVRVAVGELDGNTADGDELVVAAGTGGGPRVRVFRSDAASLADFFAFRSDFRGGANVSVAADAGVDDRLVLDAFALDPSQRNAPFNASAGVAGAARVDTAGTPASSGLAGGTAFLATTGSQGIGVGTGVDVSSGVRNPAGVGTTVTSAGSTGQTGLGSGTSVPVTGQTGVGGATTANTVSTQVTGQGGVGLATAGGSSETVRVTGGPGVGQATQAAGVSGATGATVNSGGTGATAAAVLGFGPFGDPGPAVGLPPLANPPFAPGQTRYRIVV